jgi:hypothetical protein
MYTALRATSRTLSKLLTDEFGADPNLAPFFGAAGTMQVSLSTPQQMVDATIQGLSVWLYRVVRDEERLNDPEERLGPGLVGSPPLPLRLHFLMTPISNAPKASGTEMEQLILGKTLQVFNDRPCLRGTDLQDDLSGTDAVLYVRLEPLSLQEIYQIWDALEGSYRLSVSYEVSLVDIDSAAEPRPVSPVTVALPEYAQVVGPG